MGVIGWVVLGALAGWIGNIVLDIVGALVGGFLWNLLTNSDNAIDFSIGSLVIAVIGALIVSWLYTMITSRRGV